MSFEIRKAERRRVHARVAFIGPSGAGKTYSAIHFARGLVGPEGSVVVIDTEQGSSEMYADKAGGFSVLTLEPPYSPKRYMDAIDAVEKAWAEVPNVERCLIIDQISHAWAGEGGVLDYVDAQAANSKGNSFAAWKKGTPIQQAFLERMLRVAGHLIVTMRSKTEWVLEKDPNTGRQVPRKVGLAPVQRNDIEYEWQIVFEVEQDSNQARATKDRTSLYAGRVFVPGEEHGAKLAAFLAAGKELAKPEPPAPKGDEKIDAKQLETLIGAAKTGGRQKEEFLAVVEKVVGHRSPKDVLASQFAAILEALSQPKNTSALDALA